MKQIELGYFGNIWVRQNILNKAGDTHGGHQHLFDHVTLLTKGRVEVEVEGFPVKQFEAPTFIIIRKDHQHKITALTDDVLYYCVFALRNLNGEVIDQMYDDRHDPLSSAARPPMPTDGKYEWDEATTSWTAIAE
jgi:hypothetical protein